MSNYALAYETNDKNRETSSGFSNVICQFRKPQHIDKTGADILEFNDFFQSKSTDLIPLWNIKLNNVPMSVPVFHEGEHWFAELDWLDLIATGDSPESAIQDLELQIDYFINYYNDESIENLTAHAIELRNRFLMVTRTQ